MGQQIGSEQIFHQLREEILAGKRVANETLPPIRELALKLGISKNTVALAYQKLASEGYVRARKGSGYYVESRKDSFFSLENVEIQTKSWNRDATKENTYEWKQYPWERMEQLVCENMKRIRKGICYSEAYHGSYSDIQIWLSKQLKQRFGRIVSPERFILFSNVIDAMEQLRVLFDHFSRDIAFLEPCHPMIREILQEDSFQVHGFHRRMRKTEQEYQEKKRFRILFGYIEQYMFEISRPTPDNQWLPEWLLETQSMLLMFDTGLTSDPGLWEQLSLEWRDRIEQNVIQIGTFNRLLPGEISLNYLLLPEWYMEKYYSIVKPKYQIYSLSYQLSFAKLCVEEDVENAFLSNIESMRQQKKDVELMLKQFFGEVVRVVWELEYLADGVMVEVSDGFKYVCEEKHQMWNSIKKYFHFAQEYWYFDKSLSRNRFLIEYRDIEEIRHLME